MVYLYIVEIHKTNNTVLWQEIASANILRDENMKYSVTYESH